MGAKVSDDSPFLQKVAVPIGRLTDWVLCHQAFVSSLPCAFYLGISVLKVP